MSRSLLGAFLGASGEIEQADKPVKSGLTALGVIPPTGLKDQEVASWATSKGLTSQKCRKQRLQGPACVGYQPETISQPEAGSATSLRYASKSCRLFNQPTLAEPSASYLETIFSQFWE
ncbi:hypothetical protein QSF17_005322 [Escherichia coli]|nr:hypothetical protein [Escherichia coli]